MKGRLLTGVVLGVWFISDGVSVASVETRWVPMEDTYQTPSLYTVYVDPDFISLDGSAVVLRQLTDYLLMQGNAGFGRFGPGPHRFFSTVTRKEFHCLDKRVRLLAFTEFSHHMGTGRPAEGSVDQSQWLRIEPASINEGLWKIACSHR
ncbi:MAG: hypothetical protein HP496_15810 [Nitrospira sp.]|nr:hypothetical protein [Nitrospira sp.]